MLPQAQARLNATLSFASKLGPDLLFTQQNILDHLDIIRINALEIGGPDLAIQARGELSPDRDGFVKGTLELKLHNMRRFLENLDMTMDVPEDMKNLMLGMEMLLADEAKKLKIELRFRDGRTYLGSIPLGPAPKFAFP